MGLTKLVLKFAAPLPKIEEYNRFLFIGPHPDDIEIGAGATAAKLVDMGKEVRFLVCIDGRLKLALRKRKVAHAHYDGVLGFGIRNGAHSHPQRQQQTGKLLHLSSLHFPVFIQINRHALFPPF